MTSFPSIAVNSAAAECDHQHTPQEIKTVALPEASACNRLGQLNSNNMALSVGCFDSFGKGTTNIIRSLGRGGFRNRLLLLISLLQYLCYFLLTGPSPALSRQQYDTSWKVAGVPCRGVVRFVSSSS